MINLETLYRARFNDTIAKDKIWQVLCKNFFQRFIGENDTVLDLAAGYCEFINNIRAKRKIALDLNSDFMKKANSDVECLNESFEKITDIIEQNSIDVVFISNFFEHLERKEQIVEILSQLYKILKTGGKVLILQPNIKYVKEGYWDFIDHKLPLTDTALIEAGEMCGFKLVKKIPKFLPYTTKSKIPKFKYLIRLYLLFLPVSGFFMGKQSFIILEK